MHLICSKPKIRPDGPNGKEVEVPAWKIGDPNYIQIDKNGEVRMQKDFTQTYHYALHEAFGNGTTSTSAPITTPSTEATTTTQNGKQELSSSRYLAMLLFTALVYLR